MKSAIRRNWRQLMSAAVAAARLPAMFRAGEMLKKLGHDALELVYPGTCLSCGVELGGTVRPITDVLFCSECYDELDLFTGPACAQCGAPVPSVAGERIDAGVAAIKAPGCYRCRGRKLWFDAAVAAGAYEGLFREFILRMKTAKGDALSLAIGRLIWRLRGEQLVSLQADVVAPIPLHWRRRLAHRTNSASVVAEILADRLKLPLAEGLLRRHRHTAPQSTMTPPQRWTNVRQAFSLGAGQHLNQAHVLLVDDILTTGATCSEAARVLRKAGAARVTVVVAARAMT